MKRISISILFAVSLTLLSGWLVFDSQADSNPRDSLQQPFQSDYFTIQLPDGLKAATYTLDDEQNLVTFENADGTGFQVFTLPFNGPVPLTSEGLRQELPDLVINDLENTTVHTEPALAFDSQDPDIGDTFEVWFVHNGLLYQVMTYRPLENWLRDILVSWRFK